MSGVTLETLSDREVELRTMMRVRDLCPDTTFTRFPDKSVVDFALIRGEEVVHLIEVKTRKEEANVVKGYGGLILKQKKREELHALSEAMNVPASVVFSFSNAEGEMWRTIPLVDIDAEPVAPPRRRNYRGLACDEDLVLFLDWDRHIERIA
tara:strand:+ start:279 stop:734 length:456 start_codon:yes stop_codon:yes gene_type:complete